MKKTDTVETCGAKHKMHICAGICILMIMCVVLAICVQSLSVAKKTSLVLEGIYSEMHQNEKNAGIHYTASATELVRLETKFLDISNDLKEIRSMAIIKGK